MGTTSVQATQSEVELRVEEAIEYLEGNPDAKLATVARLFEIPRSRLRRRFNGCSTKKGRPATNTKLSREEEVALSHYIDRLDAINFAVRAEFITDAANYIIKERSPSSLAGQFEPVGKLWTTRFIQRHGYSKCLQKKLDSNRQASEDVTRVLQYYQQLQAVIEAHGIPPDDIWNMDETGFRIGIGKDQLIVTKRKRAHLFSMPENRESATAIEGISAAGRHLPAFLILTGQKHMERWYHTKELDNNTKITVSSSGYSNDEISLGWLKHFIEFATPMSSKRLLILDGHGSHHTIEFIELCEKHDIIPFGMPPNLTHILQPLDVVVFQPLKHYHAKAIDLMARDGITQITKLEFLRCIESVRKQAFKPSTIISAFNKTGIYPFNPQPIIQDLTERAAVLRTPSPAATEPHGSSDFETPMTLRQINKVADKLDYTLQQDDSIDPEFSYNIGRFIRGSLIAATELIQTKRDLGRTKKAELISQRCRAMKNRPLKTGGIISVANAREMVRQKAFDEVDKARRVIEAADKKRHNLVKKAYFETAKKARRWRRESLLEPLEIWDKKGVHRVRRG
ncbi:hypothetical protein H634G_11103 [Metarhizium anisopliae BRIP 53293]|uniref:HTH CENPB-type domain-containing protein n=1 Tax=Metarhizium anisopliae BRIP 53293 TaxID=1291518 RepID=A0A0D9NIV1_METAN|nr:hypothetical protein H634G_11103 [Metarhizium anisopliae BRIP 53293]KJK86877.1 hypothetical protein H633G_09274 [Metarhizium anisopliae BRIP 53284]